jgi:hypothetical protein
MENKSAVEWLVQQFPIRMQNYIQKDVETAKQMEKEQIQKAFSDGQQTPMNHPTLPHYSSEEYYNDTYNVLYIGQNPN